MHNSGWQKARARAGLGQVRVHNLKHTFGRRLRAAGVSFENRQDLLGHKTGKITTHYSAAELEGLIRDFPIELNFYWKPLENHHDFIEV
jgi:integrase